ncbi:MAG: HlyD family secretion protein, partial [Candidatus Methylophosphatis roskildensis]
MIPLIAIVGVGIVYLRGGRYVETDNAYVKADKVPVSAEVSGPIKEVLVLENQPVAAGQVLFRIDAAPFQVAVARAEAKLAQVRTDLAATKASFRAKQAEMTLARTRYAFARKDQQRKADLIARNFIPASTFDDAQQTTDLARQQIDVLQQDLKRIAEILGGSVDAPVERHPSYLGALAELQQARLDLARVEVRAPLPGIVSKPPKPGQFVTAGSVALALVVNSRLWIEANFPETDLTYVHPGQPVTIHIDTYPSTTWVGMV